MTSTPYATPPQASRRSALFSLARTSSMWAALLTASSRSLRAGMVVRAGCAGVAPGAESRCARVVVHGGRLLATETVGRWGREAADASGMSGVRQVIFDGTASRGKEVSAGRRWLRR